MIFQFPLTTDVETDAAVHEEELPSYVKVPLTVTLQSVRPDESLQVAVFDPFLVEVALEFNVPKSSIVI